MELKNVLITGAQGYIGSLFLKTCLQEQGKTFDKIVAMDLREANNKISGVTYYACDIRSNEVENIIKNNNINIIVHLAAILSSADNADRDLEYDVDVNGSKKLVEYALKHGCKKFITTSSGAAYGYYPENVDKWLVETDPTNGNREVPYAYHKKLVDEYLQDIQAKNPNFEVYVFRTGTILGSTTRNLITDLFTKKKILCLKGYKSPFVFIWDQDLSQILLKACKDGKKGVYNIAGDGSLSMQEVAKILGKKTMSIPPGLLKGAFTILHPLKLSKHGPIAISFIQYRPVLLNDKLKNEFAYTPQKTTKETFDYFIEQNKDYVN